MVTGIGAILQSTDSMLLSHSQLRAWTDALAAGFRKSGVGPGDIVAACLPNSPAFVTVMQSAWSVGAAFAPLNPLLTRRETAAIVELVRPKVIVASPDLDAGEVAVAWPDPFSAPPDIARSAVRAVAPGSAAEDDRLILFTSGSTGTPKAVALTEANVSAGIAAVATHFALTEDDTTIGWLPWTHGHGLFASLLAPLRTGGTIVLPTPGQTHQPQQLLAAARPTWMTLVPSQLDYVAEALEMTGARPSGLRFIRTASAPLPDATLLRAERLFGTPVIQSLGMTETAHQMAADTPTWDRVLGSVGMPTPQLLADGVRLDSMQVRFTGENILGGGLMEVRGPQVARGYLGNAEATAAAMTADGWYRTGDVVAIGEGGRLRFIGRRGDLVNRGGFDVAPAEVEAVLAQHPDVAASVVVAIAHDRLGQEVAALVVRRPGGRAVERDIIAHCRANLAPDKVPGRCAFVEAIPHLANRKINRREAAKLAEQLFKAAA